jgi:UDP-glucose 4-epimerase
MPRILVTGGAGLIGSSFCEVALREGAEPVVLDNLSAGRRAHVPAGAEFVEGDVCDDALVAALLRRCDAVCHLAAAVGVRLVLGRPTGTLRQSLLGTETVLRHAAALRKPLFFASSSEVYGDAGSAPLSEERPLGFGSAESLRFGYAAGKAAGEALAFAYAHEYGLPVAVGRFFNVTGPRQTTDGAVVPRLVGQALRGGPLTVHGDGAQTRSFLDAADAAEYVWRLLRLAAPGGLLCNVGREEPVTIADLAGRIRDLVDPAPRIEFVEPDYGPGFAPIRHRRPDTARLLGATGYRARVPLDATLRACVGATRAAR